VPDPALFAPNYPPPRSVEINFGIQRELRHGMVFSANYLRNIETRNLRNGTGVYGLGAQRQIEFGLRFVF
jgi:hypothetical protein